MLRLPDDWCYLFLINMMNLCVCVLWNASLLLLQIIILWNSEKPPPSRSKWPPMPVPLTVTDGRRKVRSSATHSSHWRLLRRLSDSKTICQSRQSVYVSLTLLIDVYFILSCPCTSDMFTDPCGIHLHKCHSFPPSLPVCLFFPPHKTKSIVIHSFQSVSMIYCNIIISHSFLDSLKSQARLHIPYSTITKIYYCISLSDHQSVSTSRCHRDRSSTESGRGYSTTDQWGVCPRVGNKHTAGVCYN